MARFRKVDPRIWNDAKFMALGDDSKLIFLFALTHPGLTILGAMRATIPGLADELGWTPERFAKGFAEPLSEGLFSYDKNGRLLWIKNYLKYNQIENPNQLVAAISALDLIPECATKYHVYQSLAVFSERFNKPLPEPLPKPLPEPFAEPLPKPVTRAVAVAG